PRGGWADETGFSVGARQKGGNQGPGCDSAGEREQRRFGERIGGLSAGLIERLDRALAWRGGLGAAAGVLSSGHVAVSVAFCLVAALRLLRVLRLSLTPPAMRPARSISGSRARNMVIAATTPVAAIGRARTASTASSARSAPLPLAPCHASLASVRGLSRSCKSCAVAISRARDRSASIRAATTAGGSGLVMPSVTGRASAAERRTNRG